METNNTHITPFLATHPCEIVKDELKARGISKKEFADRMQMLPSNISRLLRANTPITAEVAHKLENALNIPAKTWMALQLQYNEDTKNIKNRNAKEHTAITIENMLSGIVNMKALYERLHIKTTLFLHEKLNILQELLSIKPQDIPQLNICFQGNYKKSEKFEENMRNETTWRLLAYISAKQNAPTTSFKIENTEKAAEEIATAVHKGNIKETDIKNILNKNGISYSVVEKLDKTHIDGFSAWVENTPSIVTTHRHNDMPRLVFTILHELGHIKLHIKQGDTKAYTTTDKTYSSTDKEEIEANQFAENHLINKSLWQEMMNNNSRINNKDIVATLKRLAKQNNLNFGIVAWRYKYETNKYALRGVNTIHIQ